MTSRMPPDCFCKAAIAAYNGFMQCTTKPICTRSSSFESRMSFSRIGMVSLVSDNVKAYGRSKVIWS